MNTLYSVFVGSALIATFLALEISNSSAGTASIPSSAGTTCHETEAGFVHDKEKISLFLLYHNPSLGALPALPRTPDRPTTLSI